MMKEADLDRYRGPIRQSEEGLESAEADHAAIGHLAGMRLFRARIGGGDGVLQKRNRRTVLVRGSR